MHTCERLQLRRSQLPRNESWVVEPLVLPKYSDSQYRRWIEIERLNLIPRHLVQQPAPTPTASSTSHKDFPRYGSRRRWRSPREVGIRKLSLGAISTLSQRATVRISGTGSSSSSSSRIQDRRNGFVTAALHVCCLGKEYEGWEDYSGRAANDTQNSCTDRPAADKNTHSFTLHIS
ncbi:hypothetical protein PoMZ_10839 [Pyricularia oryzae]|uniref:Uncharacterized protein n=1 Tax=Pyricularia oryzae TaxID=318829 RepID=A0A4P7NJ24_PYROR|nr:hypothetical protein PoMZ_10839 [Pyricularia oryzae]